MRHIPENPEMFHTVAHQAKNVHEIGLASPWYMKTHHDSITFLVFVNRNWIFASLSIADFFSAGTLSSRGLIKSFSFWFSSGLDRKYNKEQMFVGEAWSGFNEKLLAVDRINVWLADGAIDHFRFGISLVSAYGHEFINFAVVMITEISIISWECDLFLGRGF